MFDWFFELPPWIALLLAGGAVVFVLVFVMLQQEANKEYGPGNFGKWVDQVKRDQADKKEIERLEREVRKKELEDKLRQK